MAFTNPKTWASEVLTSTDLNTHVRDNLNYVKDNIGLGTSTELTIDAGVIGKTKGYHSVDTEGDIAEDDLDTINNGDEGDVIFIRAENADRTVVVKNETGNIKLNGDYDYSMESTDAYLVLIYDGSNWNEIARSQNGIRYWHHHHIGAYTASQGGTAATFIAPDANTLGGYQLDSATEKLYFTMHVGQDWDEASDLEVKVTWEKNDAAGSAGDTVDLKLECYYKGHNETSNKRQTLEEAVTIDASEQYARWVTNFTIDYDAVDNVVERADKITMVLNLETDTSECDDITVNEIIFRYKALTPAVVVS